LPASDINLPLLDSIPCSFDFDPFVDVVHKLHLVVIVLKIREGGELKLVHCPFNVVRLYLIGKSHR
jgi:hypothetical protein